MNSAIVQVLEDIKREYGTEVYEKLRKKLDELELEGVRGAWAVVFQNLKLEDNYIGVVVELDGRLVYVIYDRDWGEAEVYDELELDLVCDGDHDDEIIDSLTGEEGWCIPRGEMDELHMYGNTFTLIVEGEDSYYKIRGVFLDKIVRVPFYVFEEPEDIDEAMMLFEKHREVIYDVLRSYTWIANGYRGHYEGKREGVEFVKVVEGWVGLGSHDESIEKLAKLEKLEIDPPLTPILFVFPRSSNICVTYFDVYVPKDKVEEFKKWFGTVDKFDYSKGINIYTYT